MKEWTLGCVKSLPAARSSQDARFTQPRDQFFKPGLYGQRFFSDTCLAEANLQPHSCKVTELRAFELRKILRNSNLESKLIAEAI